MAFGSSSSELPESQIEYRNTSGGRRWVSLIIYLVLALLVATMVVFAGRWVYHKVSNNSGPAPTTVTPIGTNQGAKTPSPTTPPPSNSNSASPVPSKTSPTTPPSTPPANSKSSGAAVKPGPQPAALPNNGPGQALALFVATTFVAATMHFMVAIRKAAKIA
jgi:cytoskeletal protein RodZ